MKYDIPMAGQNVIHIDRLQKLVNLLVEARVPIWITKNADNNMLTVHMDEFKQEAASVEDASLLDYHLAVANLALRMLALPRMCDAQGDAENLLRSIFQTALEAQKGSPSPSS